VSLVIKVILIIDMWDINNDLTLTQSLNPALVSMNDECRTVWALTKIDKAALRITNDFLMISCFMYCTHKRHCFKVTCSNILSKTTFFFAVISYLLSSIKLSTADKLY